MEREIIFGRLSASQRPLPMPATVPMLLPAHRFYRLPCPPLWHGGIPYPVTWRASGYGSVIHAAATAE